MDKEELCFPTEPLFVNKEPNIVINCKEIKLTQNSLGIEIDISKSIGEFKYIIINGIKYRRIKE